MFLSSMKIFARPILLYDSDMEGSPVKNKKKTPLHLKHFFNKKGKQKI